jgi:pantoate--beta-alanine ligase
MQTVATRTALRSAVNRWRTAEERVALVPTMGNLHAGHLRLVEQAAQLADRVVVSIFVNPLQFGEDEDFATYPRTLEADSRQLAEQGADLLFAPTVEEMYPGAAESLTRVEVTGLSDALCGAFRPGHFVGVATVVAKLFNLVMPDVAVFGEKDYQQLTVIQRMTSDLFLPVHVVGVATVREPDGLAMSSRNAYLAPEERAQAPELYRALCQAAERLQQGERDRQAIEAEGVARLTAAGFRPDYFALRRAADLAVPDPAETELVVLGAARLGRTRLIDNVRISLKDPV